MIKLSKIKKYKKREITKDVLRDDFVKYNRAFLLKYEDILGRFEECRSSRDKKRCLLQLEGLINRLLNDDFEIRYLCYATLVGANFKNRCPLEDVEARIEIERMKKVRTEYELWN